MVTGLSRQFIVRGNMSLYGDYIRERTTDNIIEAPSGWATYRYLSDRKSVYIVDIYTVPEERKKGGASALADMIAEEAKERGYTEMLGTICPSAKGSTNSMKALLGYGFELMSASNDAIILRKDL